MTENGTIICERCGKEEARRGTNQKYCFDCAHELLLAKRRERWHERRQRILYERALAESAIEDPPPRKMLTCARCGIETPRNAWNQKYCPDCAYAAKLEARARYLHKLFHQEQEVQAPVQTLTKKPKRRKPKLTLQQVAALAKEAGMTYGQYVANMEQEK